MIMDCTRVNGTLFCALCSDVTNRASLLAVAGLTPGVGFEVFVHEREWALNDHDAIGVHSGYCVTFVPPQHPPFVVAHLADMLHDPLAWNPAAELPGLHGRWVNLLTDDEPYQVLPSPQRVLPARVEFAALLGYTLDRLVLQPAHPPIRDHFDRGILSDNVIIVSQLVASDAEHILYVLDMRPVLCGLTWGVARLGRVRVRPILDRFFGVCPEGYQAVMRGGRTDPGGYLNACWSSLARSCLYTSLLLRRRGRLALLTPMPTSPPTPLMEAPRRQAMSQLVAVQMYLHSHHQRQVALALLPPSFCKVRLGKGPAAAHRDVRSGPAAPPPSCGPSLFGLPAFR